MTKAPFRLRCAQVAIGLNVGDVEPIDQEPKTRLQLDKLGGERVSYGVYASEWLGTPERTIQARVCFSDSHSAFLGRVATVARVLKQEHIAVLFENASVWTLVSQNAVISTGGTLADYPVKTPEEV